MARRRNPGGNGLAAGDGNGSGHEDDRTPGPEEIDRYRARSVDAKLPAGERFLAMAWLGEHGLLPEDPDEGEAGADPGRTRTASTATPYTQGKPLGGSAPAPTCGVPLTSPLSRVEAAPVDWLWPGRFPRGMISLVYGDGGEGKSQLLLAIAAAVTRGAPWPDMPDSRAPEGSVLLIQAEDSLRHTVRPRVDAAGADPARIHALTGIRRPDRVEVPFSLRAHADAVGAAVDQIKDVRLVIIDPISAFLGGADENGNAEVRDVLSPLAALAEARNFAVILNHHSNKGAGTKAIYRASGSAAFINASRVSWFVCRDPDQPARAFMAPVKFNVCPCPSAMAFGFKDHAIEFDPRPILGLHANMILARERTLLQADADVPRTGKRGRLPRKLKACIDRLTEYLADGPKAQTDALAIARAAGFSNGTFYDSVARGPFRKVVIDGLTRLEIADRLPLGYEGEEGAGD